MCRKEKLNEYFSEFSDIILPIFLNKIFESGILPASWSKAVIKPLHKKEIPTIPETTEESVSPVVLENSSHQF